jgi:uncharacterized membrane protein
MNKARVESFSDGVFAFAITLLVLGFQVPSLDSASDPLLRKALLAQLPQLTPYPAATVIAFFSQKTAVAIFLALALFYFLPNSTGRSEVTQ